MRDINDGLGFPKRAANFPNLLHAIATIEFRRFKSIVRAHFQIQTMGPSPARNSLNEPIYISNLCARGKCIREARIKPRG